MIVDSILRWAQVNMAEIDNTEILRWANEARDLICLEYPPYSMVTFTATDEIRSFKLPGLFLYTNKIRSAGMDYDTGKVSSPVPGYIEFKDPGSYELYFGSLLSPMITDNIGEEIGVHRLLEPLIFDYLMYKYYDSFAQGDEEESIFATKFYEYFNNKLAYLSGRLSDFENISYSPDDPVPMKER